MSLSNAYENLILDHVFGGQTLTLPATLQVGLIKNTVPWDESTALVEPSPTFGYSRLTVNNDKTTFTSASVGGSISNDIELEFPVATGGSWGTITYIGLFDPTTGDLIAYGEVVGGVTVDDGTKVYFPENNIIITLD